VRKISTDNKLRPGLNGLFELSRFIGKRVVKAGKGAQKNRVVVFPESEMRALNKTSKISAGAHSSGNQKFGGFQPLS